MKAKFFKFAVFISCASMILTGCGTLGGAVTGAGEDLQRAGAWIKSN